jgi:hypothetical protein
MQSKKGSFIEAVINTAVGFIITLLFSPVIYWVCDVKIEFTQIGMATVLFTILSIVRSYFIRRLFNKKSI